MKQLTENKQIKQSRNFVICPCCGNKILFDNTEYRFVPRWEPSILMNARYNTKIHKFRICYECGGCFTKVPYEPIKKGSISEHFSVVFLFVMFIMAVIANKFFTAAIILLIDILMGIAVEIFHCSKFLKKPENGYLPVFNDDDSIKEIVYISEKSADLFKKQRVINNYLHTAVIVLPDYNCSMQVCLSESISESKLIKYHAYKMVSDNSEYFFILVDYAADNQKLVLKMKMMNTCESKIKLLEDYTLYSLDDDKICKIEAIDFIL